MVDAPFDKENTEVAEGTAAAACPYSSAEETVPGDSGGGPLRPVEDIPAPPPASLLGWRGNLLRYFRDPISYLRRLRSDQGKVARLVSGSNSPIVFRPTHENTSTVFVLGPEGARDVLTEPDVFVGGKFRTPKAFDWMNSSMVAALGERRQQRRGTMAPAFSRDHLQSYIPEVVQQCRLLLNRWLKSGTIDLAGEMYDMASGVASTCFFGQDSGTDQSNLAATVRRFGEGLVSPLAAIPIDLPGTPYNRMRRYGQEIQRQLFAEIEKKRASDKVGKDILAMMIASQDEQGLELEDDELMGDAVAIFLAGHDVPANAITFCLLLLSQHPDGLEQLLDELDREVDGDVPSYQDLWRLPVLDRVVKESLRVFGPSLLILRQAATTGTIQGYEIPPGTEVLVCPYTIHTDPEVWDHPRRFIPDRWLKSRPSAFEFLPFSYGARRCLGASFAELMIKIVVSMVTKNVRLTPQEGTEIDFSCTFVISPKKKIEVHVVPQDHRFDESRVELRGQVTDLVEFQ